MKAYFLLYFLFCSMMLNAQQSPAPSNPPLEFINIKLSKFPIADFPRKSMPVSDIRIMQFVRDSVRVGYALKGMDNYVVNLKITKPLTSFLQDHIYRMYKDDFKKEGIKMLWILKDLRIGEKVGFMEYSYARVNMDGYISSDGALYKKACSVDSVYVIESGGDVSKWHSEDIENAFGVFSKRVLLYAKDVLADNSRPLTMDEIVNNSYQDLQVPILTDTIYREGIYSNFEEFLQNKPSITAYETLLIDKSTVKFTRKSATGNVDTIDMWGVCKAGEIYKYYESSLIPIEKKGTGFIISDFIQNSNRRNKNVAFFSILGGMAGGVVGGMAAGLAVSALKNRLLLVKSIPYITKPAKQPVASCIDMKTGDLSF